jgi:hypothetical protein
MLVDQVPPSEVALAKRDAKRSWALHLARRYARRAIRARFDGAFVDGLDEVEALCRRGPVIFAANHVCWWDAFVLVSVDAALGTDGRVLMDEDNLERLPFFSAIGALPISRTGGARVRRQLADATATRRMPSAASASSRSRVTPPIANVGSAISAATRARNSRGANSPNDFVCDGKQGPMPR